MTLFPLGISGQTHAGGGPLQQLVMDCILCRMCPEGQCLPGAGAKVLPQLEPSQRTPPALFLSPWCTL